LVRVPALHWLAHEQQAAAVLASAKAKALSIAAEKAAKQAQAAASRARDAKTAQENAAKGPQFKHVKNGVQLLTNAVQTQMATAEQQEAAQEKKSKLAKQRHQKKRQRAAKEKQAKILPSALASAADVVVKNHLSGYKRPTAFAPNLKKAMVHGMQKALSIAMEENLQAVEKAKKVVPPAANGKAPAAAVVQSSSQPSASSVYEKANPQFRVLPAARSNPEEDHMISDAI
jgi:hypothetical protein